jgi:uncharacterized membrane protein HdeD (DUF308 family)
MIRRFNYLFDKQFIFLYDYFGSDLMKQKIDFIEGILVLIIGIISIILPLFSITSPKFILQFIMLSYTIINLFRYILVRKTKDYEGLFTAIVSLVLFISLYFINLSNNSLTLSLSVFAFVIAMSFVRLKKSDYYHDRKDKNWILELTCLIMFIISGFITSINILVVSDGKIFMIGYLFLINGFIELIDPIINYIKK